MQRHRPFSRATWCIYLVLLAFRVFIAISPGYIHPDEFFQSAEITAGNIFHIEADIPWEYRPEQPCRSILIPAITTGIPYLVLKTWIGNDSGRFVTTRALFLTQRLAFVLVSLVIDWAVVKMARQIRRSPSIALLLVSSSYVTLAYHTHPFSNTVETVILALCATVLGSIIKHHDSFASSASSMDVQAGSTSASAPASARGAGNTSSKTTPAILSLTLGVLFSLGIFTRITFVLYGFPLGVMFLYLNARASFKQGGSQLKGLYQFITACIPLALGLGLMSAAAIVIDSIYFHKLVIYNRTNGASLSLKQLLFMAPQDWINIGYTGSLTVTMLNNLRYNLDEKNLAEHGLHPRFFHLLLNYPVLFLNLAWIGVTTVIQKIRARQWTSESKLVTALTYSGICGMSILSAMPHQEARFLTPLILPLVVSLSGRISKLGRSFWPLWLLANGAMAIIFGLFHQSGLVPAIDLIQRQSFAFQDCEKVATSTGDHMLCFLNPSQSRALHINNDGMSYETHVVFYKTYLPPYHLFGYNKRVANSQGVALSISDWRSKSRTQLLDDLAGSTTERIDRTLLESVQQKGDRQAVLFRKVGPTQYERTILIAPATVDFSDEAFYRTRDTFARHANFDHVDVLLQDPLRTLFLNMFYI